MGVNFSRGKAYLAKVKSAKARAIFPTADLRQAFTDIGANVDESEKGNLLIVAHGNKQTGYVFFTDRTKEYCHKPAGLPMFNIFSAVLN